MGAVAAISAVTAISAYQQSQGQRAEGEAQRGMFEANARISDLRAEDARIRGEQEARKRLTQTRGLIGAQRAALAAQGIDIESGTALELQQETAGFGALDALTIRNNAAREAWGYTVEGEDLRARGLFSSLAAENRAGATLATGGLQAARDFYAFSGSRTVPRASSSVGGYPNPYKSRGTPGGIGSQ